MFVSTYRCMLKSWTNLSPLNVCSYIGLYFGKKINIFACFLYRNHQLSLEKKIYPLYARKSNSFETIYIFICINIYIVQYITFEVIVLCFFILSLKIMLYGILLLLLLTSSSFQAISTLYVIRICIIIAVLKVKH